MLMKWSFLWKIGEHHAFDQELHYDYDIFMIEKDEYI